MNPLDSFVFFLSLITTFKVVKMLWAEAADPRDDFNLEGHMGTVAHTG